MERQASPASSQPVHHTSYYRDANGIPIEQPVNPVGFRSDPQPAPQSQPQQQVGSPLTTVPIATSSSTMRSKGRAGYQSGIAAGAEDVKYAAKYKELKAKVREIEADNDRLIFKVLQAKRNIQRAKLERAILYERLGALPASPPAANAALPPQHVAQQVPPGAQSSRHAEVYAQAGRRQRSQQGASGHHQQYHQQPIQPAPASHVSPPQHHSQMHVPHHSSRDAHPGQLPITHAPQVCTVQTQDGPLLVVAGPDGLPVTTENGHVIPAQDIHAPPPSSGASVRKRGNRVSKEERQIREREAREIREREEIERRERDQTLYAGGSGVHGPRSASSSRSHSAHMQGVSPQLAAQASGAPQITPTPSREQRERDRDWEHEREMRDRERAVRRETHVDEDRHGHQAHGGSAHSHGHRYHQQQQERGRSPPHVSQSYGSQHHTNRHHAHGHSHGHHSHSHSASPRSPGGTVHASQRMHGHQRVGPGSYSMRERVEPAPAEPAPATTQQNDDASQPQPSTASSNTRVPTPPYMQRPFRAEAFNNQSAPAGDEAAPGPKSEAHPSEDSSAARSASTTPP